MERKKDFSTRIEGRGKADKPLNTSRAMKPHQPNCGLVAVCVFLGALIAGTFFIFCLEV
jgi:hypothetical protein